MIYNPNEIIEVPKIGMLKIGVPKIPMPNVFGAVVRRGGEDDDIEKYIENSLSPYILPNASWNTSTGVVTKGWLDGSIAIVPIPEGVTKVFISIDNSFSENKQPNEIFYRGDGGARFYIDNPLNTASLYRANVDASSIFNYLVNLKGTEKYFAAYTRLKYGNSNYNYNDITRVRFYYKGKKPQIESPTIEMSTLMRGYALSAINNLGEVKTPENITIPSQAFDTLSEEEIALATSKGWSVVSA